MSSLPLQDHPEVFGAFEQYSFGKWVWACMVFQTRGYEGSEVGVVQLLPLVDMLDHSGNQTYLEQVSIKI